MMLKWIPLKGNDELNDMAIVTRTIIGKGGVPIKDVTIGYSGWSLSNKTIAYMPLPKSILEKPELWKSEYREDEPPRKNMAVIAQLMGNQSYNEGKLKIIESYYLAKENKFLRIPNDWEVVGWMAFPKPFIPKNI